MSTTSGTSSLARAVTDFRQRHGEPDVVTRAPGRVNLIGEHTDYNEGFVLPMALPFDVVVALGSVGDASTGPIEVWSEGFETLAIDPTADPRDTADWARQITGTAALLARDHGIEAGGWRASIATDIPTGASVSSSAAIEVAIALALLERAGQGWDAVELAKLGQRVENEIVGIPSGIMDQLIVAGAVEGAATLIDCRSLTLTPVPLPGDAAVVLMDTGTRRVLADAAYADRRASCERVAAELGLASLRDATEADLDRISDPTDRRRATHVLTENARTLAAVDAMERGDGAELGHLMSASHRSLRDDFEVSGPGLNAIVDIADGIEGCLGARMTGGGFAGCAVALVDRDAVDRFVPTLVERYDYDGLTARVWACDPSPGATVVS